jgi:hypothetical protein
MRVAAISFFFILFPPIRSAAIWRRAPSVTRIEVDKPLFNRNTFRTFQFVLVARIVIEADDAALLTDPIDHLTNRKNCILVGRALGDGELDLSVTSIGNRGCRHSRGHKKNCDRANRNNLKVETAAPAIAAESHYFFFFAAFLAGAFLAAFFAALAIFNRPSV